MEYGSVRGDLGFKPMLDVQQGHKGIRAPEVIVQVRDALKHTIRSIDRVTTDNGVTIDPFMYKFMQKSIDDKSLA